MDSDREDIRNVLTVTSDAIARRTPYDTSSIEELVQAGEELVAFEMLCSRIDDFEISLPLELVRQLERAGTVLNADKLTLRAFGSLSLNG